MTITDRPNSLLCMFQFLKGLKLICDLMRSYRKVVCWLQSETSEIVSDLSETYLDTEESEEAE